MTNAPALRALHVPGTPLVLPNVWDAASARAVRQAGFPAIATSSAAVAHALGYEDGERTPVAEMMAAVARVSRAAEGLPVTADVERGYGLKPAELVERLAGAGASGCNLEDSLPGSGDLVDPAAQADFLAEVRAAAGDALVINARVDVYLHGRGGDLRQEAVARGRRYLEAGADCVYPILLAAEDEIAALVSELDAPVNVYFGAGGPGIQRLAELGVARISFGSGLHRASQAFTEGLIAEVREGRSPF
ncbi:isocitrate lyase/phosphoenolpyruvate mutase family protein [Nonomuraea sp. PA05]|uniref:isocitrate lyase/PEP mutase family protein n=1 Tax=Nonomuraea sp. PA05 TaxID=2604466 RepID=UPI0011DA3DD1|nr:isocitrate lyase/phosphoenolpyruvate mutase family protein [Nonomuraea sp. PA05]TYB58619.1 isocitrate lyase/phosphoenolpyruvate mutase family protein [Nonomuraea sp. PA05]